MMGRQTVDQSQLFYLFNLEEHIPADHLLRRINPIVTRVLADLREKLAPFYSDIGRPPKLILGWPASPKVRAPSLVHWAPCLPVPSLRSGRNELGAIISSPQHLSNRNSSGPLRRFWDARVSEFKS